MDFKGILKLSQFDLKQLIVKKEFEEIIKNINKNTDELTIVNCIFFSKCCTNKTVYLSNQCGSSAGLILPVGGNLRLAFIVPCQTMDT